MAVGSKHHAAGAIVNPVGKRRLQSPQHYGMNGSMRAQASTAMASSEPSACNADTVAFLLRYFSAHSQSGILFVYSCRKVFCFLSDYSVPKLMALFGAGLDGVEAVFGILVPADDLSSGSENSILICPIFFSSEFFALSRTVQVFNAFSYSLHIARRCDSGALIL